MLWFLLSFNIQLLYTIQSSEVTQYNADNYIHHRLPVSQYISKGIIYYSSCECLWLRYRLHYLGDIRSQISCESICHSHNATKGIIFESLWLQTWTDSYTMLQSDTLPLLFLAHLCLHLSNVVYRPIRHRGECRFDFSWLRCTILQNSEFLQRHSMATHIFHHTMLTNWHIIPTCLLVLLSRCIYYWTFYPCFCSQWNSPMISYIDVILQVRIRVETISKNRMTGILGQWVLNAQSMSWSNYMSSITSARFHHRRMSVPMKTYLESPMLHASSRETHQMWSCFVHVSTCIDRGCVEHLIVHVRFEFAVNLPSSMSHTSTVYLHFFHSRGTSRNHLMSTFIQYEADIDICLDTVFRSSDFIEHIFLYFVFLPLFIETTESQRAFC
jgi:hypothetical protein